jgi:hypothetical protein
MGGARRATPLVPGAARMASRRVIAFRYPGSEGGTEPLWQICRRLAPARPPMRVRNGVIERVSNMNASIISALAALGGATIGGLTSVVGGLVDPTETGTAQELAQDKLRRQELYKEFIQDASKSYADALQHDKPDISALIEIYTKISRMRVLSSPKVVESAEQVSRAIVDAYLAPNAAVSDLHDLMDKGGSILFAFSPRLVGQNLSVASPPLKLRAHTDMETLLKLPQRLRSEISHQQS